jgi:hypothetical protein
MAGVQIEEERESSPSSQNVEAYKSLVHGHLAPISYIREQRRLVSLASFLILLDEIDLMCFQILISILISCAVCAC